MNVEEIVNQEIAEMRKRGKDLHWTGKNEKGKMETGKKAFARERDMNPETYALRRQIIDIVYRAKNLLRKKLNYDLPRQTVRIIDVDPTVFLAYEGKYIPNHLLGCATLGGNDIYIPAETLSSEYDVLEIVYHELLHSAFCIDHDPKSIIMSPYGVRKGKYSPEQLDDELIKEVIKSGKVNVQNKI